MTWSDVATGVAALAKHKVAGPTPVTRSRANRQRFRPPSYLPPLCDAAALATQPALELVTAMAEPFADTLATVTAGRTALVERLRTIAARVEALSLESAAEVLVLSSRPWRHSSERRRWLSNAPLPAARPSGGVARPPHGRRLMRARTGRPQAWTSASRAMLQRTSDPGGVKDNGGSNRVLSPP
jgi:hypothetical protein